MISPCTGADTVVEHLDMIEITGNEQDDAQKHFRYASNQINNHQNGGENTEEIKVIDSDEGDAFDRLIKKTYDRDCEKFF